MDFDNNYLTNEHRRFFEEDVFTHFVVNYGLIFIFQLVVITLFIIVKVMHSIKTKPVP